MVYTVMDVVCQIKCLLATTVGAFGLENNYGNYKREILQSVKCGEVWIGYLIARVSRASKQSERSMRSLVPGCSPQ